MNERGASLSAFLVASVLGVPLDAIAQKTHRLMAGPATVAFGHYDPEKPGVLRIVPGDIVDVTTMLTSNPNRLQQMGLPASEVAGQPRHDLR